MRNPKIGLIGKHSKTFQDIRNYLDASLLLDVIPFHHASVFARATQNTKFQAMVLVLEYFGDEQVQLIEKIDEQFPHAPVVIMADEIEASSLTKIKHINKKSVLHSVTEKKDLLGVLLRMTNPAASQTDSGIYYRTYKRNRTMQFAQVVDQKHLQEQEINARILDLSKGGAQMQIFKGTYSVGDDIQIRIPLTQVKKVHTIKAKVVWLKDDNTHSIHQKQTVRLGLRFGA